MHNENRGLASSDEETRKRVAREGEKHLMVVAYKVNLKKENLNSR